VEPHLKTPFFSFAYCPLLFTGSQPVLGGLTPDLCLSILHLNETAFGLAVMAHIHFNLAMPVILTPI
jgi:hypothetical protein